jgi:hypothetical protein
MKQSISGLLDKYRYADCNTRLHLYLQYPDLRTEFIEIDRSDLCRKQEDRMRSAKCISTVQKSNFFGVMAGCMRRLCRGPERRTT